MRAAVRFGLVVVASVAVGAVGAVVACTVGACTGAAYRTAGPAAEVVPEVSLATRGGANQTIRQVAAGKVAVLDLWATWCPACKTGIPKMRRLAQAYGDRLVVIGVDVGEAPAASEAFVRDEGITYPIVYDPEFQLADQLGARHVPTVLVVDQDGRIVHRSDTLDDATLDAIHHLVGN